MSCVAGIKHEGKVYMGADGWATAGDGEIRPIVADKLFRNGEYLFGYTGSVRTGQVLMPHNFDPPEDILDLPEAMREHLYARGCVAIAEEGIQMHTCNILIGHKGDLYEILVDFQLNKTRGNYTTVGSGGPYAMGALFVLERTKLNPVDKLEIALSASIKFQNSCGRPFDFDVI